MKLFEHQKISLPEGPYRTLACGCLETSKVFRDSKYEKHCEVFRVGACAKDHVELTLGEVKALTMWVMMLPQILDGLEDLNESLKTDGITTAKVKDNPFTTHALSTLKSLIYLIERANK